MVVVERPRRMYHVSLSVAVGVLFVERGLPSTAMSIMEWVIADRSIRQSRIAVLGRLLHRPVRLLSAVPWCGKRISRLHFELNATRDAELEVDAMQRRIARSQSHTQVTTSIICRSVIASVESCLWILRRIVVRLASNDNWVNSSSGKLSRAFCYAVANSVSFQT